MYLLYCIFQNSDVQSQAVLPGVDGQPVFPVAANGIGAAVSEFGDTYLAPDILRVVAYKKVIESFHGDRTVIPMRYGCVLNDRLQVVRLLKRNAHRYESLLKELDGCVEMGIRVLIDDYRLKIEELRNSEIGTQTAELKGTDKQSGQDNLQSKIQNPKSEITGRTYLADRKAYYAKEEHTTEARNGIIEQFRTALTGFFVKYKVEPSSSFNRPSAIKMADKFPVADSQPSMLSLYFLVPGKSIDPFRQVFRKMRRRLKTTRLLLSGPWPPYNFVLPDNEQRRAGVPDRTNEETREGCPER